MKITKLSLKSRYQRRKSKEKIGRVTKGPKLPFEMIAEILSWLTVDALLRVKSASKKWCSLIEDHHHIVKHMNLASPLPIKCRYGRYHGQIPPSSQ
ncbi:hypothetical protein GBA52_014672 [Prunus armeniaca]|nr:hypothetical protein GBA52_014672 [Prunus armeniaca]